MEISDKDKFEIVDRLQTALEKMIKRQIAQERSRLQAYIIREVEKAADYAVQVAAGEELSKRYRVVLEPKG